MLAHPPLLPASGPAQLSPQSLLSLRSSLEWRNQAQPWPDAQVICIELAPPWFDFWMTSGFCSSVLTFARLLFVQEFVPSSYATRMPSWAYVPLFWIRLEVRRPPGDLP